MSSETQVRQRARRSRGGRRRTVVVLVAAVVAVPLAGAAWAAAPDGDTNVIHACYSRDGELRVIDPSSRDRKLRECTSKESAIAWNQEGPRGEPGLPGSAGSQGEQGEQGEKGEKGEQGEKGEPGDDGVEGAPGPTGAPGAAGAPGQKGDPGEPGPAGPAGPLGATGPQGVQGPAGPAGRAAGREVVTAVTYTSGTYGEVTAMCPPGKVVTGGGYRLPIGFNGALNSNRSTFTGQGWYITVDVPSSTSWRLEVAAICVDG